MTQEIERLVERSLFLASGQDDPHSQTIIELCDALTALIKREGERDDLWRKCRQLSADCDVLKAANMTLRAREGEREDAFNSRFQDLLYALIDSKSDGLRDCTVTEIVNVAAVAFVEAGKDAALYGE